jgi:hypothetical protein
VPIELIDVISHLDFIFLTRACIMRATEPAFACGIACNEEEGYIFTGTSNGNITVIQVPSNSGEGINFDCTLSTSDYPVMALGSSTEIIAAGNDNGDVFGFSASSGTKFSRQCKFNGTGSPCTVVCVQNTTIYAAFSLGSIRVYNSVSSEMTIEVCEFPMFTVYVLFVYVSIYLFRQYGAGYRTCTVHLRDDRASIYSRHCEL